MYDYISNDNNITIDALTEGDNEIIVLSNSKSYSLGQNAMTFLFYYYLTNLKLHKERDIELHSYFGSTQVTKSDWIS